MWNRISFAIVIALAAAALVATWFIVTHHGLLAARSRPSKISRRIGTVTCQVRHGTQVAVYLRV